MKRFESLPTVPDAINQQRTTVVVNMFGGPGSGKTTAALEVTEKLKKAGYIVEYAPEYAKELVWEINDPNGGDGRRAYAREMLSGNYESQVKLYAEQIRRVQRCLGQCDFVVTDSPAILGVAYLKEDYPQQRDDFEKMALRDFNGMRNFNMFVKRDGEYEQAGRVHGIDEAKAVDETVNRFLDEHGIYHGVYSHSQIDKAIENMQKTLKRFASHDAARKNLREETGNAHRGQSQAAEEVPHEAVEGRLVRYNDTEHKGPSYEPRDDMSGTYRITDVSSYPDSVKVELVESDTRQNPGTSTIYRFDEQVKSGEIEFVVPPAGDKSATTPEKLPFPTPSMLEVSPRGNGIAGEVYEYRCSGEEHAYELAFEHAPETGDWMARVYVDDGKLGNPSETACYTSLHPTFKEAYTRAYERVCDEAGPVLITDPRPKGKALRIDRVFTDKELSRIQPLEPITPAPPSDHGLSASIRNNMIAR